MGQITALYDAGGPFASAYLDATSAVEQADSLLALRWRNARRQLSDAGADAAQLAAMESATQGAHPGGYILGLVADGSGRVRRWHLPRGTTPDAVRVGALPFVVPLLAAEQAMPAHLVVLADRAGADVAAVDRGEVEDREEVVGDELHITRSAPTGVRCRRCQQPGRPASPMVGMCAAPAGGTIAAPNRSTDQGLPIRAGGALTEGR